MKRIILILLSFLFLHTYSQDKKKEVLTATFKVSGNCGECKQRIENAVDIKGVKTSSWNKDTKILTVVYRADKVTVEQIKAAILKSGHDVENAKAGDAAYQKLPMCCHYRDKECREKK